MNIIPVDKRIIGFTWNLFLSSLELHLEMCRIWSTEAQDKILNLSGTYLGDYWADFHDLKALWPYMPTSLVISPWWRHQMETFSALLALCAGNSPVPVNSTHKGQWRGALMFSLIYAWINDWINNRKAGDLRRHCGHYDVIVMPRSPRWLQMGPRGPYLFCDLIYTGLIFAFMIYKRTYGNIRHLVSF